MCVVTFGEKHSAGGSELSPSALFTKGDAQAAEESGAFEKVSDEQLRDLPVYQEFMAAVPTWYSTAQTARGVGASKAQRFVLSNRAKHEAQIWHGD